MKTKILLMIILFLSLISCNKNQDKSILVKPGKIPLEIICEERIKFPTNFRCEWESAHSKRIFNLTWFKNNIREIQYCVGRTTKSILILSDYLFSGANKANYIKWENGDSNNEEISGISFFDCELGKSTKWIETNISPNLIKRLYPDINCVIKEKSYSKIIIDFSKDLQTLEFFESIKFIE